VGIRVECLGFRVQVHTCGACLGRPLRKLEARALLEGSALGCRVPLIRLRGTSSPVSGGDVTISRYNPKERIQFLCKSVPCRRLN